MRTDTPNLGMPGKLLSFRIGVLETSTSEVSASHGTCKRNLRGDGSTASSFSLSRSGETDAVSVAGGASTTDDVAMVYGAHHEPHINLFPTSFLCEPF